ncbi:MAG: EAL domain-containing protein [Methylococcales bacterium]|nr:EAL domain-containing protein [Methylococcales bacterium]
MQILIDFFDINDLMPHGYCLSWSPLLLWLHVASDVLITLSYYSIPLSLLYFVRQRKDLPYPWLITMFAVFIIACGTTHLLSVVTIWLPVYWIEGMVKAFTAFISVATAIAMWWVIPLALKLPSPAQLQAEIDYRKQIDKAHQEALERLQKIAGRLPGMVYQFRLFPDGSAHIPYCSEGIRDIFRLSPEQVCGDSRLIFTLIHRDDYARVVESMEQSAQHLTIWLCEFRVCLADGDEHWLLANALPQREQDGATLWHGFISDISERKSAETELRIAAAAFDSQEGMVITDTDSIILRVNAAFTAITGYSSDEAVGRKMNLLKSGRHDDEFYKVMWDSITSTGSWQGEIWDRRKNGEIYPKWLTITAVKSADGKVSHYVGTHIDITERKATEEHINRLAFYDPLTQLPNRRLLQERLKQGIKMNHRLKDQMAVLMMDLDKFKAVNDTLGHTAGDELLQQVAERIQMQLREVDMVARLGGDEFVVLMENVGHYEHVARVAEAIIHALSQPFTLCQSYDVVIGTSIGIAIHPQHGDTMEALMDNADTALYHAKDQGRGCFAYFSEKLTQKARERIVLESRLRRAIEQQELRVYFQPQIDIASGQIIGAEALVRWHDPIEGCLMPRSFITLAEETGLIVAIGEWVLRETCKIGQQWLDQGLPPITLAVNVSPHQFRRSDMNALVAAVLHDTGFPAEYLELEITESGLMDNQKHTASILNRLNKQGVHLAIDDFGTGYSSLAYLKYFPVDILKIDKTFIDDIPFLHGDMAITATIIAMAHHLGFKVLAEGVETQEQLAFLREQGCDMYQGYLYSKAVPADNFKKMLTDTQT